jgi:hypothetical protein
MVGIDDAWSLLNPNQYFWRPGTQLIAFRYEPPSLRAREYAGAGNSSASDDDLLTSGLIRVHDVDLLLELLVLSTVGTIGQAKLEER